MALCGRNRPVRNLRIALILCCSLVIVGISSALPKDPTQSASVHLSAGLQHKFFPNQDVETERIGARPIFELMGAAKSAFGETRVPLSGFVLKNAPADKAVKPMLSTQPMSVQVMLHRNNEAAMVPLLNSIYDRNSPIFHRYLSVTDRREKFSPKIENFRAVGAYFQSQGLKIIDHQVDRTSLTVSGTVGQIQKAFGVRLSEYFEPTDQRSWHFVDRAPEVPTSISPLILEVQNLNTVALPQPNARFVKETPSNLSPALLDIWPFSDQGIPAGEIRKMYGMGLGLKFSDGTPVGGQGEKLALVEFGGYNSDVVAA